MNPRIGDQTETKFTRRERDCLEQIRDEGSVKLVRLSKYLNVKPPTAYSIVQRLIGKGAVSRDKNNTIMLTALGEKNAESIIFRHRVLETLLTKNGVSVSDACTECKKLDFLISDKVAKELFIRLKEPKLCPHGKPIRILQNSANMV